MNRKNEEISRRKAHTNTWKLTWNVSMNLDAFSIRVNVCEHMVKLVPREIFTKLPHGTGFTMCSHTFTLLIEKDICDSWNISIKLQCVCLCLLPRDLFFFFGRDSSFFSYFLSYLYFGTFFFMQLSHVFIPIFVISIILFLSSVYYRFAILGSNEWLYYIWDMLNK